MKPVIEILTLAEAAEFLKVSERTLWQLAKDGQIPHGKVGRQYRFEKSRLASWAGCSNREVSA